MKAFNWSSGPRTKKKKKRRKKTKKKNQKKKKKKMDRTQPERKDTTHNHKHLTAPSTYTSSSRDEGSEHQDKKKIVLKAKDQHRKRDVDPKEGTEIPLHSCGKIRLGTKSGPKT